MILYVLKGQGIKKKKLLLQMLKFFVLFSCCCHQLFLLFFSREIYSKLFQCQNPQNSLQNSLVTMTILIICTYLFVINCCTINSGNIPPCRLPFSFVVSSHHFHYHLTIETTAYIGKCSTFFRGKKKKNDISSCSYQNTGIGMQMCIYV